MTLLISALALMPADLATAQPAWPPTSFPNGVPAFYAKEGQTNIRTAHVAFYISTDPGFHFVQPDMAHQNGPIRFLGVMNGRISNPPTQGSFAQANGTPGSIQIYLRFFSDSTQDHVGVHVTVTGFENSSSSIGTGQGATGCTWFHFDLPAYYTTSDSAADAAANKVMDYYLNGWTLR